MNKDEMIKIQQIEQMAMMDCQRVPRGTNCADCPFASADRCNSYRMATALVNANYRKVEDDEIVIKESEYQALLRVNSDLAVAQKSIQILEQAKQETAREILFTIYTYLKGAMTQQTTALMIVKALAEHYGIELGEVEK